MTIIEVNEPQGKTEAIVICRSSHQKDPVIPSYMKRFNRERVMDLNGTLAIDMEDDRDKFTDMLTSAQEHDVLAHAGSGDIVIYYFNDAGDHPIQNALAA